MHQLNLIHSDMKPENIFIGNDYNLKIGDFGVSSFQNEKLGLAQGTAPYQAPEAWDKDSMNTTALDIWGTGCILYELLTGKKAFDQKNSEDLKFAITVGSPKRMKKYSREIKFFVMRQLLNKNAKKRLTAEKILDIAFLKELGKEKPEEVNLLFDRGSIMSKLSDLETEETNRNGSNIIESNAV